MTLSPVQFGEAIKVEGERASSAAARLEEQYKAEGKPVAILSPQLAGEDTLLLTEREAEQYDAITSRDKKRALLKLLQYLPVEVVSTVTGRSKNVPEGEEAYPFMLRLMKRVSDKLLVTTKPELEALMANPRVVQAADILPAEEEITDALVSDLTVDNFAETVEQSPVPVLVDFWAPWCGPCKQIAPFVEELAEENEGQVKVVRVNVDENEALARRYGVQGVPQLLLLSNGDEVARHVGSAPKKKLAAFLSNNL